MDLKLTRDSQQTAGQNPQADQKKQRKDIEKLRRSLPTKTTLNLTIPVSRQNKLSTVIPTAIVIAILIGVFTKFAVIDRLNEVSRREADVAALQAQVDVANDGLKDMEEIRQQYYRYTTYFMTESEISVVDRVELLNMLTKTGETKNVQLRSVAVSNNRISLMVTGPDLKAIGDYVDALKKDPRVVNAVLGNASSAKIASGSVYNASITMEVTNETEETEGGKK